MQASDPVASKTASDRGAGPLGFAGTVSNASEQAAGLATMLADCSAQRCNLHPESRGSTTRVRPAMATEFNGKIELDIRDS
ncbi:MAG: hypothetical protein WCC28_18400, partial [Mycobacterium sp.]